MIVGAVLALIGTVLPWASEGSVSLNGFDEFFWIRDFSLFELNSPAIVAVIGAVIMLGLGIATAAAGRVLAVTIIGIISAVLGVLGGLVLFALMADFTDSAGGSIGIGVILQPIAPIISGVGAIWATAKRRRHPGV